MRNAHGVEKDKRVMIRASLVIRRALKLLERTHVELRRACGGVENGTLVVKEGAHVD